MNLNRERILQRLRAAAHADSSPDLPAYHDATIFSNHPSQEDLLERFGTKLCALKGELFRARDVRAAAIQTKTLLSSFANEAPRVCLRQSHTVIDQMLAQDPWLQTQTAPLADDFSNTAFAQYEAGLTVADFLIARTGSIVLNAASAGGRRLSVLPPLHIVIASAAQVVASLEDALARVDKARASYMTIITGPSRTSDIEKILVLGAHGPKRLAVIVIDKHGL